MSDDKAAWLLALRRLTTAAYDIWKDEDADEIATHLDAAKRAAAARRVLADALYDLFEHVTAGKAVGGSLSAEPADGSDPAKAPPPAVVNPASPAISEGGRESGSDTQGRFGSGRMSAPTVPPESQAAAIPAPSVDEARAALQAAQDREDAVRGERVMGRLAEGTLTPATVKALGARWPMPRSARFGEPDSSLQARLMKAGTVAVGRYCRVHDVGGEER